MQSAAAAELITGRLGERLLASEAFFAAQAEQIALLCQAMSERFAAGGRLIALGASPAARSDARHVAVEFVHPVIVGKRALPAIAVTAEGGPIDEQFAGLATAQDIVLGFDVEHDKSGQVVAALRLARAIGCLTVAFAPVGADWELEPPTAEPFVRQELIETLYHVLWELVHVFFEHRPLAAHHAASADGAGAASFLYPFLSPQEQHIEPMLRDVSASASMKAQEIGELRGRTLIESQDGLIAAARSLRSSQDIGGRVLAFGNGGSATDAMDLVADLRSPPQGAGDGDSGSWPSRRAIDLTEDTSILTAVANDVGVEEIFQRQLIAQARPGDVAVAFSTSGGSENLIAALAEARRRGLGTIAFVGYDGGRIAAERLAEHVILSPSQHIPRIQEAQASAYHVLRELIEVVEPAR